MEVKTSGITLPSWRVVMFRTWEFSLHPDKVHTDNVTAYFVKGTKPVRLPEEREDKTMYLEHRPGLFLAYNGVTCNMVATWLVSLYLLKRGCLILQEKRVYFFFFFF